MTALNLPDVYKHRQSVSYKIYFLANGVKHSRFICIICDVISKQLHYGGTNSVTLDQLFAQIRDSTRG